MKKIRKKILLNKRNQQLIITLPKKKLGIKKRLPKFLNIKREDLEY